MKKRIFTVVMSMMMLLTSCSFPSDGIDTESTDTKDNAPASDTAETKVPETEAENVKPTSPTAMEVAEGMNLGINLGNTFEAYYADDCDKIEYEWMPTVGNNKTSDYENLWGGGRSRQSTLDGMKAAGFDTVRIPVFWGNMMENDGTWTINKAYIKRVREVVDYATNSGMYAVINIHHFDEFIIRRHTTDEACEIFSHLWTQIAEYFRDCPYTVIFEGYNEYLGGNRFNENGELTELGSREAYELTNRANQAFVDAVRATGGNNAERVLIASGYHTNIDKTTAKPFDMPVDTVPDRLMVSVHYIDNNMYWGKDIGSQKWLDYIDDQCNKLDSAFTTNGIPVFVGETTASYPEDRIDEDAIYKTSPECLRVMLDEVYKRGYVSVLWTTGSDYYDRKNCVMADIPHAEIISEISGELRK